MAQSIDANLIRPKVESSSVSINPLASNVTLLVGGMLWGMVGLGVVIPITGMMKLMFDEIPAMQPWGYLLGEKKAFSESPRIQLPFGPKNPRPNRP